MSGPGGEREEVRQKANRLRRARSASSSIWRHLANVGVLGWIFLLPVLLGLVAGRLIAGRLGLGRGPVLAGLLVGLVVGAWTSWWHVRRSLEDRDDEGGAP